ncbi:Ig-like domain-containing protein [Steroidobacter flavus]|uniref:Ig-like domain-containing protein n=1 Tax=Steroidobacter flavus TaxID=1842136 RepID=A0ABV8SLV7_9GAMM
MRSRILLAAGVLLASFTVQAAMDVQWRTTTFGTGIGATGIWPVDADHDGDLDFVLGGGFAFSQNATWSIVSYDAAAHRYEIAWQSVAPGSPPYPYDQSIQALRVVETGGTQRVWIGRANGTVDVVDLATRETLQTLSPSGALVTDFAVEDIDNNGALEVAVVTQAQTFLYNAQTLALERTLAYGGSHAAVGNIDNDAELELVFNTGAVLQVGTSSVTEEWVSSIAFGERVELADIDGDGRDEIVGADAWYLIRAWDAELHSLKWSKGVSLDISAFKVVDVTGDSTPEILYGDGQWGYVHALDAATQNELWNIQNADSGVTNIAVFDADGDGARELLFGAGWHSTGPDHLNVHDLATQAQEWQNTIYSGPYSAVDIGDVDADGRLEMVIASYSDYGTTDGAISMIRVYDAITNELEWSSVGQTYYGGRALKLINIDADPQLEIALSADNSMIVIDGLTHQVQSETLHSGYTTLSALDAADLTGDGIPEVIVGNMEQSTGSTGARVYVMDPVNGTVIWQSAVFATGFAQVTDVLATDVGAPGPDIIGVSSQVHVIRWSDRRHIYSAGANYLSVTTGEVAPNAGVEILAGKNAGSLDVLDGETLALIDTHTVCATPIRALEMQASNRVLVACDDQLIVYDLATRTAIESKAAGTVWLGRSGSLVRSSINGRAVVLAGGLQAVKFVDDSGNNAPLLTVTPVSVHWRTPTEMQLSASDANNDPLRFEMLTTPLRGTAIWTDQATGRLRYSGSLEGGTGTDTVRVRVSDGYQYSDTQTLQITVTNTGPTATAAGHDLNPGATTMSGRFSASDPNGDPLTYSIVRQPTRGTLTFDATAGTYQYVGTGSPSQTDSVTFAVRDGLSQAEATVEFRYVAARSSGGGGGGGAFGALMPALLALMVGLRRRAHRARLT